MMDDQQRIALVETRTDTTMPEQVVRYQLGNHLGSASLELDDAGQIISYEEYHPYGSTSYQAGRSGAEVSLKRYRYTGMERDEESGFGYHSARYYAAWVGRWTVADPTGLADGLNIYQYARSHPVALTDPKGTDSKEALPKIPMRSYTPSLDLSVISEEGPFTIQTTEFYPETYLGRETGWTFVSTRTTTGIARRIRDGWSYDQLSSVTTTLRQWSDIERPPPADLSEVLSKLPKLKEVSSQVRATRIYHPAKPETKGWFSKALNWIQHGLDALSLALDASGVGALVSWIPDVLNAGISAGRGDWLGTGLSLAATLPFVGSVSNTTRLARSAKQAKAVSKATAGGGDGVRYFLHGAPVTALDDIVNNGVRPVSQNTHGLPIGSFFTVEAIPKPGLFGGVAGAIEAHVTASHMALRHGGSGVLVGRVPARVIDDMGEGVFKGPLLGFGEETVFLPRTIGTLNDNVTWTFMRVQF
jgi:RHS repeat-associated protein